MEAEMVLLVYVVRVVPGDCPLHLFLDVTILQYLHLKTYLSSLPPSGLSLTDTQLWCLALSA